MTDKKPDRWMPFYPADYLRDTARLTTELHGAYLLLILDYWVSGAPLPDNDVELAAIARMSPRKWAAARPILIEFFRAADGKWHHKRIDEELVIASERIGKRVRAGRAGAAAKWSNRDGNANGKANGIANGNGTKIDGNAYAPSPSNLKEPREEGSETPTPEARAGGFSGKAVVIGADGIAECRKVYPFDDLLARLAMYDAKFAERAEFPTLSRVLAWLLQDATRRKAGAIDPATAPASEASEKLRGYLLAFKRTGKWMESWGPRPDTAEAAA